MDIRFLIFLATENSPQLEKLQSRSSVERWKFKGPVPAIIAGVNQTLLTAVKKSHLEKPQENKNILLNCVALWTARYSKPLWVSPVVPVLFLRWCSDSGSAVHHPRAASTYTLGVHTWKCGVFLSAHATTAQFQRNTTLTPIFLHVLGNVVCTRHSGPTHKRKKTPPPNRLLRASWHKHFRETTQRKITQTVIFNM